VDWNNVPEEIAQHLEDRYNDLRAQGRSDGEARAEALREIDGDASRPTRSTLRQSMLADILPDTQYTLRGLRRNPAFAIVIILTLALGIGANSAIFSIVNAVVLRPLPYDADGRVVVVWGDLRRPGFHEIPASAGEYVDYRDRSRTFDRVAAYDTDGFNLSGDGNPERIEGAVVTPSLFPLLGVNAEIGRTFLPDEEQPGRDHVVVIGHALWSRRFNADPSIIGRAIAVDGKPLRVAGVMPAGFHFPDDATEIWKPILIDADAVSDNNRGSHGYTVLASMRPGVTLEQARADANAVAGGFAKEHPGNYRNGFGVTLRPWRDEIVGATDRPLMMLLGAVALVLLIACANVANLLLARSSARTHEIALRAALGASRRRLVRQLLTESVVIAALGGSVGMLLATWGVRAIVALAPSGIPRIGEASLDARVLLFTTLVAAGTGLVFGVVPALRATRAAGGPSIRSRLAGRASPANLLVIAEVALSFVLLAGAGLLVRSFARLQTTQPGFDSARLLTFRLSLPLARYTTFAEGDRFFDELFAALGANPGVTGVGAIHAMPFSGNGGSRSFDIEGRTLRRPEDQTEEQLRIVSDGYFAAMRMPILAGRVFTARDTRDAPRVAIVNDAFARKHFPGGSAIGARLTFSKAEPRWYQIVGIAANVKHRGLDAADRPELYVPYKQPLFDSWTVRPMYVVVRTAGDPLSAVSVVRREVARLDVDQPIADVRSMDARIQESLGGRRFSMVLLGLFAAFALALAAIGLYGVIAYSVSHRTREIGVRIALGAQRADVLRLIVVRGMALAGIGVTVGLAAAVGAVRALSSLLFGVQPLDPATFIVVPIVLLASAWAACYLPARRATRVDALTALRE
jgi:putative ABC transport system permease protein